LPGPPASRLPASRRTDLLLIFLTFDGGAVDAMTFLGLGQVFTANMTGNLVLMGIGVARGSGAEVFRSAVALVAFVFGAVAALRLAGLGPTRPWSTGFRAALGFKLLLQVTFLAGWLAVSGRPGTELEAVLIAVSALAMGTQTGAVRALAVEEISTTYVTGTLAGLIGELAERTGSREDRARRALVLAALLAGAACSALLVLYARPAAPALPLAVTLLVLALDVNPPRRLAADANDGVAAR
jgi:uncharacterized membrane protein YoaK (UPF0700 family)